MGHMSRAKCTVHLISVPDQPGRKRMYRQPSAYTVFLATQYDLLFSFFHLLLNYSSNSLKKPRKQRTSCSTKQEKLRAYRPSMYLYCGQAHMILKRLHPLSSQFVYVRQFYMLSHLLVTPLL
jgi:hypothetical protein